MAQISIVIPAYNADNTIGQCLNSILRQSFRDYEIIVVNDGSTDKTLKILEQFEDRIEIISQKNQGAAAARNQGAARANSEFIIFCDADIVMKPMMLEKMFSALKNNSNAAYCYSSFQFGFKTFKLWPFDTVKLKQMPYIHTTSLIRRQSFPGFDESLKRFQDWDLWLTMLEKNQFGCFIPEVLFTVKSGGTMSAWLPKIFYRLPWKSAKVKKYQAAEEVIRTKHKLN